MALRTIVTEGDECLRKVCRPVTAFNARLHQLLDDMNDTLVEASGAGLAAPQVGVLCRYNTDKEFKGVSVFADADPTD